MDFFGNVQNVEVDSVGNETEWREDLLALGKKIKELRERADAIDAEAKNATAPAPEHESYNMRRIKAAKVEVDDSWLGKRAVGAWALLGCALVWTAGSYLEAI